MEDSYKIKNEKDYIKMVNYLISTINNQNAQNPQAQNKDFPIFLFEFFVFELYLPREILSQLRQPILAFRLLDFPTLSIQGNIIHSKDRVVFNQGKSSYFEMKVNELKDSLANDPMYIMLIDLNYGDMKIIGSCRLNISIFCYDSFLQYPDWEDVPEARRNILTLYDNTMNKIGEFEMSLLIRRDYYKSESNMKKSQMNKSQINKSQVNKSQVNTSTVFNKSENKSLKSSLKQSKKPRYMQLMQDTNIQMAINDINNQPQTFNINTNTNSSSHKKECKAANFNLEGKDKAYNAHPVNKEIRVPPKKKRKVEKSEAVIQTEDLDTNGKPIHPELLKKFTPYIIKTKNRQKKELSDNQSINNMYKKAQRKLERAIEQNKVDMGDNENAIESPSKQSTGFYLDKKMGIDKKQSPKRYDNVYLTNNDNENITESLKADNYEYLNLVSDIKDKVEDYKRKTEQEIKQEQKVLETSRKVQSNLQNIEEKEEEKDSVNTGSVALSKEINISNNKKTPHNQTEDYNDFELSPDGETSINKSKFNNESVKNIPKKNILEETIQEERTNSKKQQSSHNTLEDEYNDFEEVSQTKNKNTSTKHKNTSMSIKEKSDTSMMESIINSTNKNNNISTKQIPFDDKSTAKKYKVDSSKKSDNIQKFSNLTQSPYGDMIKSNEYDNKEDSTLKRFTNTSNYNMNRDLSKKESIQEDIKEELYSQNRNGFLRETSHSKMQINQSSIPEHISTNKFTNIFQKSISRGLETNEIEEALIG